MTVCGLVLGRCVGQRGGDEVEKVCNLCYTWECFSNKGSILNRVVAFISWLEKGALESCRLFY